MARLKNLVEEQISQADIITTTVSSAIDVSECNTISLQAVIDVDTPAAKTFDSGVAAFLVVQDLTYTADLRGVAGNSISIAYTAGAVAGSEVVTVVGSAISVQISTGVSTATQVKTAVDASVAASALISVAVTGTGGNAQVTASITPLAGGVASEVDTSTESVSIPTHGFVTGLLGRLTSTGTLPTGVTTGVDYFIIVVDASTVQFASSLVNALAGTAIDLTSQGSSAAVNTFTPTAIAGATIKLEKSNNNVDWKDVAAATAITVDANLWIEVIDPTFRYVRISATLTAGSMSIENYLLGKGLD